MAEGQDPNRGHKRLAIMTKRFFRKEGQVCLIEYDGFDPSNVNVVSTRRYPPRQHYEGETPPRGQFRGVDCRRLEREPTFNAGPQGELRTPERRAPEPLPTLYTPQLPHGTRERQVQPRRLYPSPVPGSQEAVDLYTRQTMTDMVNAARQSNISPDSIRRLEEIAGEACQDLI